MIEINQSELMINLYLKIFEDSNRSTKMMREIIWEILIF